MNKIITAGKTNHCGRCHTKRMFWLVDDQYRCEVCNLVLVPADKVAETADKAFRVYNELYNGEYSPPPQTAVDAAWGVWDSVTADPADFDEDEQAMFLMGTGRL